MTWDPYEDVEKVFESKDVTPEQMRWLNNTTTKVKTGKFTTQKAVLRDLQHKTDPWTRFLWEKAKGRTPALQEAISEGVQNVATYEGLGREVFGRLHNSNELQPLDNPESSDAWAKTLHDEMEKMPEFESFRRRTVGDPLWAGMGSVAMMESLGEELDKATAGKRQIPDIAKLKRQKAQAEKLQDMAGGPGEDKDIDGMLGSIKTQIINAEAVSSEAQDNLETMDSAVRQAIRNAVEKAGDRIKDMQEGFDALGCGDEAGTPGGMGATADEKFGLAQKLRQSPRFKHIAKLAGRMKSIASDKRKTRSDKAQNELHSVETGRDTLRVLPSEIALLRDDATRLHFYAKHAAGDLLQYRLEGKEKESRGPVIMCVDSSGSMEGDREVWSKAVALAILQLCQKDKRDFVLYFFDTTVQARYEFPHNKPVDANELIAACELFTAGGTSFEEVLYAACSDVEQGEETGLKRADIIMVTDGAVNVSKGLATRVQKAKKATGLNILGIVLAGDASPLEALGARIERVDGLNESTGGAFAFGDFNHVAKANHNAALEAAFTL